MNLRRLSQRLCATAWVIAYATGITVAVLTFPPCNKREPRGPKIDAEIEKLREIRSDLREIRAMIEEMRVRQAATMVPRKTGETWQYPTQIVTDHPERGWIGPITVVTNLLRIGK